MAQNGATSVRVTQWDSVRFSWTRTAQNAAENTSTINWTLELVSGSSGRIDSNVSKSWSVTIEGQTFSGSNTVGVANNATIKLASGTAKIKHDAGGAKSFSYSFSQEFEIIFSGTRIGVISGSGSGELDAIYQPSVLTLSTESLEMGSDVKITASNTNTSFTHNLAYKFADSGWLKIADGVKGDYTWTVPLKLAEMIPTKVEGTVVIRCLTYAGDKLIGQTTAFLTVRVPASVVPVISEVTITEATEAMSGMGVFAQSLSTLNVAIKASGSNGSTIKSYSSMFEKQTYTGENWTSDTIRGHGNIELRVTVTDTRGRTASRVERVTVLKYAKPIITNFQARRCDNKGTVTEDGEYMRIDYTCSVYSLEGGNTGKVTASRKAYSAYEYDNPFHNGTITEAGTTGLLTRKSALYFTNVVVEHDTTYDVILEVTDKFHSTRRLATIESDKVVLDILSDGSGVSFLEFCEDSGVTIRGQLPQSPILVKEGTDLYNLVEPGLYLVSNAVLSTVTHKPATASSKGYAMIEVIGIKGDIVRQIYRQVYEPEGSSSYDDLKIWERTSSRDWVCTHAGRGNILWTGNDTLGDGVTINLADAIRNQPNGICLVFSHAFGNYYSNSFFVHKQIFNNSTASGLLSPARCQFLMSNDGTFSTMASKNLLIYNTSITGVESNTASGTNSGITYDNSRFTLRQVIGV